MDLETQFLLGFLILVFLVVQAGFIFEKRKERKWQPEDVVLSSAKLPKLIIDLENALPPFAGVHIEIMTVTTDRFRVSLTADQVRLLYAGLPAKTLQDIYG